MAVAPKVKQIKGGLSFEWVLTPVDDIGDPVYVYDFDKVIIHENWNLTSGPGAQDALDHWVAEDFTPAGANTAPVGPFIFLTGNNAYRVLDMENSLAWVRPRLQNHTGLTGDFTFKFYCYYGEKVD